MKCNWKIFIIISKYLFEKSSQAYIQIKYTSIVSLNTGVRYCYDSTNDFGLIVFEWYTSTHYAKCHGNLHTNTHIMFSIFILTHTHVTHLSIEFNYVVVSNVFYCTTLGLMIKCLNFFEFRTYGLIILSHFLSIIFSAQSFN